MIITVDLAIYPVELVLKACHAFTARCHVQPRHDGDGRLAIEFKPREERDSLRELASEFSNALLDFRLRAIVADETRVIRELLVAQAFCEADLLDRRDIESDEALDVRGIAR
jgi:His-Xaa-Ser system protein HxsD